MSSSVVTNLQKSIIADEKSLTQLLRVTKLIAAKLNLGDVERWVDYELNGYPPDISPPHYREFSTAHVEVRHPMRGWEFAGHFNQKQNTSQPISDIERLSKGERLTMPVENNLPVRDSMGGSFGSDWPQRLVMDAGQFKGIVEAVRNELLQWTIELEKRGIKVKTWTSTIKRNNRPRINSSIFKNLQVCWVM